MTSWGEQKLQTNNDIFFDTDCISAFLWVKEESLLAKLYPGRIVIPKEVYDELSNPCVSHLKKRIDFMISKNLVNIMTMDIDSNEYRTFYKLTVKPDSGNKIIGAGEAASISLAKQHKGIVASNNLKDIMHYIKLYNLRYKTTPDILVEALQAGLIDESTGDSIWSSMISKRRKIGNCLSFSDYLKQNGLKQ